jgi:hypothetical protein
MRPQAVADSNWEIEGIGSMTKVRKARTKPAGASSRRASPNGTTKRAGVTRPAVMDAAGERRNRDGWVQMSFRAPAAVEEFVTTMCVKRKVTFQTLVLELLRRLGAPISDADLQDNRKGRKASRPSGTASQDLRSEPFAKYRDGVAAIEQLRDPRLWEQIAQQRNGHAIGQLPGTLHVIVANFVGEKAR